MSDLDKAAVAAVRAKIFDGLVTVPVFVAAVGRHPRTVQLWMNAGLPIVYIGDTAHVPVEKGTAWLRRQRDPKNPRQRGRPRKSAAAAISAAE